MMLKDVDLSKKQNIIHLTLHFETTIHNLTITSNTFFTLSFYN